MRTNDIKDPRIIAVSERVIQAARETFKDKLDKVYLFGSYARGDYDNESDIDFLIIADTSHEEACAKHNEIRDKMPGIDLEFDILVSCCVTSSNMFNKYIDSLPFYVNVVNEGVNISGKNDRYRGNPARRTGSILIRR